MGTPSSRMESLEKRQLLATNPLIIGGKTYDAAMHVAVDSAGNHVVAGIFSGTVDFDPSSASAKLTANGETDLYIAKYTADNDFIWARRYGGGAGEIDEEKLYDPSQATVADFINGASPTFQGTGEFVNALVIGSDNSIIFGGSYQGTMDFDPLSDSRGNVKSAGYQDGFVCKVDADGNTVWFSTIAGVFNDVVKSIAIDGNSNVAITGYFTRSADFNPSKKTYRIDAIGRDDVFVWKLFGTNGSLDWAVSAGGDAVDLQERDAGEGIAVDSGNNLFVTGSFAGKVDFSPGPGSFYVKAIDKADGFIWELSPKGKFVRVQSFGGKDYDSGNRILIDAENNALVAGYFDEEADLDPTSNVQTFIAADDDDYDGVKVDIFALKQDAKGNTQWITQLKGDGFEYLGDMTLDASQISIAGAFAGRLQVGTSTPVISVEGADDFEDHNSRDYSYDAFSLALSATKGAFVEINAFGSTSDDYAVGVAGSSVLAGRFKGTVDFGTGNKKSNGQDDGFLLDLT